VNWRYSVRIWRPTLRFRGPSLESREGYNGDLPLFLFLRVFDPRSTRNRSAWQYMFVYIFDRFERQVSLALRYTGCPILNNLLEYLGNKIRYKFCSCVDMFGFVGDIVLSKRVFCRWRRIGLLKVIIIFLNGTIIFQIPIIVARKMTSSKTCDKRSFKVIQGHIKLLLRGCIVSNIQIGGIRRIRSLAIVFSERGKNN